MFSRRRLDPISRYRHLMDGIDGPFPDQEAIRRSLNTDMRRRVSPLGAREHMDQHAPPLPPFHHRRPRLATGIHPGSVGYGVTAGTGSNSDSDHDNSQFNNDFGSQRRRYLNRIARVARSQVRWKHIKWTYIVNDFFLSISAFFLSSSKHYLRSCDNKFWCKEVVCFLFIESH